MFDTVLTVWTAGWAAAAGFGAWRYASRSGARAVRVAARVERVEPPRESGADITSGIPVVVGFQNPATGEQLSLPTTGGRNGMLQAAWVGRAVTVRFPAGQPYNFRVVTGLGRQRELAFPVAAACLAWIGLVARLTLGDYGIGWVPLGIGVPVALLAGYGTRAAHREGRRRRALLASAEQATGRVVASLRSTHRDDDGRTHTDYVPVMAFTTADGRAVTAVGPGYTRRSQPHTVGTAVTVHYAPADPAVFAFDRDTDRRSHGCGTAALAFFTAAGAAATVTGLVLLG